MADTPDDADTTQTQETQPTATVVEPAAPSAATSAETPDRTRRGVFVPAWLAVVLAAVLLLGGGFAAGYAVAPGGDDHRGDNVERSSPRAPVAPRGPGGGTVPSAPPRPRQPTGAQDAFLGVAVGDASGATEGAEVQDVVDGSPAGDAGLQRGDVITAVDNDPVTSGDQLRERISGHQPGDDVTLTVERNGSSDTVPVTLGAHPDPGPPDFGRAQ